jgi:Family of unknown function (DUF6011)
MSTDPNTITAPQLRYLTSLLDERDLGEDWNGEAINVIREHLPEMSKQSASDLIGVLKEKPYKTSAKNDVPAKEDNYGIPSSDALPTGRYAITSADGDLAFYRVWRGTRNPDYVKVYLMHGPDETEIPFGKGMVAIVKTIAQDAAGAAIRYGHEIGACSVCAKRLTNRVSRALGIGPICGGHFYGEEWKSTVHGAREQIKAAGLDPDGNVEEDEEVERYDVRGDYEAPKAILAEEHTPESTWVDPEPTPDEHRTWTTIKAMSRTMTDAELDSVIALLTREQEKREFAKREAEQERAAYERKTRDQSFLAR